MRATSVTDWMGKGVGLGLAAAAAPAWAADLEAASRIESVIVYPDGASVTRVLRVDVPAGASSIVVKGLGPAIDPGSVRVDGAAEGALSIGGVDIRAVPNDPAATASPEIEAQRRALQDQRADLVAQQEALAAKKETIEAYGKAGPDKLGPGTAALPVEQWATAWDTVAAALSQVQGALVEQGRRIAEVDRKLAALDQASPRPPHPSAPLRDLVIAAEATAATTADLKITYRVAAASWLPAYDARLVTGSKDVKPSLTLVRRARISQRTGEDWSGVALSVSTVRASRGTAAPEAQPLLVTLYEPPLAYEQSLSRAKAVAAPAPAAPLAEAADGAQAQASPARKAAPVQQLVAQLDSGGYQATFRVPGTVSIPADGTPKVMALSSRTSEPVLAVRTVPSQDETAYLEATFMHEEDAPLLDGEVALTRDGTYVGRGRVKLTAPGERVDLGFGADDKVKVTRVPVRKKETEPGWVGSTRTDQREFKITVRNLHAQPLKITVIDQIPVSEHGSITVETLPATTAPTEKTVGDKRGVMAWAWDYLPAEQKEIRVAYRLKWPADRDLVFTPQQRPVPLAN